MTLYQHTVGQPYSSRRSWPEGADVNWRAPGGWEMRLFLNRPTEREVREITTGRAEFALLRHQDVLFLLYRFGSGPWSDAPTHWHLTEKEEPGRELPPSLDAPDDATFRQILSLILVDASSGIVRGLRVVSFSPAFTRVLHAATREQASRPWPGDAEYDRQLQEAYQRWPNSDAMVRSAAVRCVGGGE